MNRTRLAKRLGVCPRSLRRLEAVSPLYVPAAAGLPGRRESIPPHAWRASLMLYHPEQVRLIEATMLGVMDLDEAALRWRLFRQRTVVSFEATGADLKLQHGGTELARRTSGGNTEKGEQTCRKN